jgi:hypothetical protein
MKRFLLSTVIFLVFCVPLSLAMAQDAPERGPLKQMDTNKDKEISKEEYITWSEKKAREKAEESFKRLDLNSDGVITVEEMKEAKKK